MRASGATTSSTLGRIGAGEYIGEMGLLTGSPHTATARARTRCVVYQLGREAIAALLETNAEVAAALARSVQHDIEVVNQKGAAAAAGNTGLGGQLLRRIRRFFRSDAD
jgi:CRP-like cAMP-binding protein